MTAWIAALRIARREALRARGRSALVLAMIALPVAGLTFTAVAYDMLELRPAEAVERDLGSASARLSVISEGPIEQEANGLAHWQESPPQPFTPMGEKELLALLPPENRLIPDHSDDLAVQTPSGIAVVAARLTDVGDPVLNGRVKLLRGSAPKSTAEVTLTEEAAQWLGLDVGGTLKTVDPQRSYTVSGIVEYPGQLTRIVTLHPGTSLMGQESWLATEPVSRETVRRLNGVGVMVVSRELALNPPADITVHADQLAVGGIVGTLAILEIVLLCGPAFAVGARRRTRELALMATAGGEPKHVRRVILADGLVLGTVGAVIGIAAGIGAVAAGLPWIEAVAQHRAGGWRFFPLALAVIAATAVTTGLLAAMVPAFITARQSIISVLNGRKGLTRSRKRWIVTGLVLAGIGGVVSVAGASRVEQTLVMAGLALFETGLVLLTPALIGLIAKAGGLLPLAPRLALRDMARNRTSAAPAVAAVMAAVAGAVATGTLMWSLEKQWSATYVPSLPDGSVSVSAEVYPGRQRPDLSGAEALIKQVYPGATVRGVSKPYCGTEEPGCSFGLDIPLDNRCPYWEGALTMDKRLAARRDPRCGTGMGSNGWGTPIGPVIDDGSSLDTITLLGANDIAKARQFLASGGVLVDDPMYVKDGKVTVWLKSKTFEAPAMVLETGPGGADAVIPPSLLQGTGITARLDRLIVKPVASGTEAQDEQLRMLVGALGTVEVYTERGTRNDIDVITLLLGLGATVIALGAAGIATGLAASDARADLATLGAIGASPQVRRRLSASSAGLISGMGALLGTATGLAIAAILVMTINAYDTQKAIWPIAPAMPLALPWNNIPVVLAVPVLATAGAFLFTRARLPIERRI